MNIIINIHDAYGSAPVELFNSIQFDLFSSRLKAHAQQHVKVQYNIKNNEQLKKNTSHV